MNRDELDRIAARVLQRGTAVEQARLRQVLDGVPPPSDVIASFSRAQRDDGGWAPFWATDYSGIDATCYQLAQADQLGLGPETPFVADAIRFLAQRQATDGSWEEDQDQADRAPFWAMPGETAARLYLTSNAGYWLARSGLVPNGARDAADYLSPRQSMEGEMPSFVQTHWLAAGLWQYLGYEKQVTLALDYLDSRLEELPDGDLAWLLVTLLQAGIAVDNPVVNMGLDRLLALRSTGGLWESDEDAGNVVHVSIEALRALKLGGRLNV